MQDIVSTLFTEYEHKLLTIKQPINNFILIFPPNKLLINRIVDA